jgi:hypothetical protein
VWHTGPEGKAGEDVSTQKWHQREPEWQPNSWDACPASKKLDRDSGIDVRHKSRSYGSCNRISVVLCSSSLKALLLNENSKKEDFPESTIEDIKGWCEGSHFTENKLLSFAILSRHENTVLLRVYNVFHFHLELQNSWCNFKQYNVCGIQSSLQGHMPTVSQ